jgi:predicted RNase H-like HicB family nuclease
MEVVLDGAAWVATVPSIPGLVAQHATLEGVIRQVLEFETAFFAGAAR